MFLKETTSLIVSETDSVKENIKNLLPTAFIVNGIEISITHDLVLTIDGGRQSLQRFDKYQIKSDVFHLLSHT